MQQVVRFAPGAQGLLTPLLPFMQDKMVSEIMVNKPGEVYIEKHGVVTLFELEDLDPQHLSLLFQMIANESSQKLDKTSTLLSANLYDDSRVQLVIPPTSTYPTMAIRRQIGKNLRLTDYKEGSFFSLVKKSSIDNTETSASIDSDIELKKLYKSKQYAEFIELAVKFKKNIVISGGTSSGKTTFLSACLSSISNDERIIVLEDTRELFPKQPNNVCLVASKGEQGIAKVTLQDLVQASLRLRPDRIIMGEIRGAEVLDFVASASTGHSGAITSIHANSPAGAVSRMIQMYKLNNVPSMRDKEIKNLLMSVIDIIVQLVKGPKGRVMSEVYYKGG